MNPIDPVVHHLLQLGGGLLFGFAAVHKLRDPAAFRSALAGYRLLPDGLVAPVARGLPWLELGLAAALLLPASTPLAAWSAAALLALYAGAVGVNLARDRREIDCGCGGAGGSRPLGASLLVRNGVLIAALLFLLEPVSERGLTALDMATLIFATGCLALLYAAIDVALANGARRREAF